MTEPTEKNKYFYDFGESEPTEELPQNIEEFSKRVETKKQEILNKRTNNKKIQQLRQTMFKDTCKS